MQLSRIILKDNKIEKITHILIYGGYFKSSETQCLRLFTFSFFY
jgi:hypothetical protein